MDALSEFLFKYPPYLYQQGTFGFSASRLTWAAVLLLAAGVLGVTILLLRRLRATGTERGVLIACRTVAIAVLAWCLLRPVLVVASAVPSRNVVAVLVDDSRSMRIADHGDQPRAAFVRQHLASPDSSLYRALAERFQVRFYRTSGRGGRAAPLADSAFAFCCNSFNDVTVASGATIDFLAPARKGDRLMASAIPLWRAKRTGLYEITVTKQDGSPIAAFRGRAHRLQGRNIPGE